MSLMKEFKEFAVKGNVVDLAVGVIIGGAFGKIVTSLTDKVIMPPIGLLLGKVNFSQLKVVLQQAEVGPDGKEIAKEVAIGYGEFLQVTFDFVILAFVIFMMVKAINKAKKKEEKKAPETPAQEKLLAEIRDLLKKEQAEKA